MKEQDGELKEVQDEFSVTKRRIHGTVQEKGSFHGRLAHEMDETLLRDTVREFEVEQAEREGRHVRRRARGIAEDAVIY
jgi:hypothetical protein